MKPRQSVKDYLTSNVTPYQHQSSSIAPTVRDLEQAKPGFYSDDMPIIQATNPANLSNQEEIVKCLQAIYGKNSAEILQKLPIQSVSPPQYQRGVGGGSTFGNNLNIAGASGSCFSSSSSNSHSSIQHQKQEAQYNSQLHSHQTPAMNQFRVSASNVHSPQQQLPQKSVLSLHQHHQNDLSNRRLNLHHLSTSNASFANLSAVSASNATTSNTSSDLNNIGKGPSSASASHVTNVMDTLGTMDNMFYDSSLQINKDASANHQPHIRHQQLQKLLKATNNQSQVRTSSSPSAHRNELQQQGANSSPINMSHTQYPLSSQTYSTVPKSLLNLAACSSSSTSANSTSMPSSSKFSSMVVPLNLRSTRSHASSNSSSNLNNNNIYNNNNYSSNSNNNYNNNTSTASSRSFNRKLMDTALANNEADILSHKGSSGDQSNLLQQITGSATSLAQNSNNASSSKNLKQLQWSLLSDDQAPMPARSSSTKTSSSHVNPKVNPKSRKPLALSPKGAFFANLQQRTSRTSLSIGEVNKSVPTNLHVTSKNFSNSSGNIPPVQQNTVSISPNQSKDFVNSVDRKEIESALSRVEARNDLSLLYPPMLLASSSQKQINAFSAGFDCAEESDVFTKEVKRIILEECNIIYECKECNNLFRSLANLVRHKREFCTEHVVERSSMEVHKRAQVNAISPMDQQAISSNSAANFVSETEQMPTDDQEQNLVGPDSRMDDSQSVGISSNQKAADRSSTIGSVEMMQLLKDLEARKVLHERDGPKTRSSRGANLSTQSNLSKILQSTPKNRLPVTRDTVLTNALNMNPTSTTEAHSNNPMSAFESDKNSNCSSSNVHEQLVCNSTLAKTLLNEHVKSNNSSQSLMELSKVLSAESSVPRTTKRVAPKRKFLEDCIQKVKRDKLLPEEEDAETRPDEQETLQKSKDASEREELCSQQQVDEQSTTQKSREVSEEEDVCAEQQPDEQDSQQKSKEVDISEDELEIEGGEDREEAGEERKEIGEGEAVVQVEDHIGHANTSEAPPSSPLFEKYTCDICDLNLDDLVSLMNHTIDEHKTEKIVYPCIFCSFSFIALENVCRHIIDIHKKPKAQVHRLKDVVKSRSHMTSDYIGCIDYPPVNACDRDMGSDPLHNDDIPDVIDVEREGLSDTNQGPMTDESSVQVKVTCDSSDADSDNNDPLDPESISDDGSSDGGEEGGEEEEEEDEEAREEEDAGGSVAREEEEVQEEDEAREEDESREGDDDDDEEEEEEEEATSNITSDPNPSSSSASSNGGIMKLKIQLKTRPDEKSKVYEIV